MRQLTLERAIIPDGAAKINPNRSPVDEDRLRSVFTVEEYYTDEEIVGALYGIYCRTCDEEFLESVILLIIYFQYEIPKDLSCRTVINRKQSCATENLKY